MKKNRTTRANLETLDKLCGAQCIEPDALLESEAPKLRRFAS